MNKSYLLPKSAIAGITGVVGAISFGTTVQAAQIYNIPRGRFVPVEKFAVFGSSDDLNQLPCPLCDSTVSSTAYRTLGDGN